MKAEIEHEKPNSSSKKSEGTGSTTQKFSTPKRVCDFCGRITNHSANGKVCLICGLVHQT